MLILRRLHIQTQILESWLQPYWRHKLQLRVCPQWRQGSSVSILLCCCSVAKSYLTLATPWTGASRSSLSMRFTSQEYWSGSPFPSPGDLPDPGIELTSSALASGFSLPLSHQSRPHFLCVCSAVQSCLTLCYPMDCNPQDSSAHASSFISQWLAKVLPENCSTPGSCQVVPLAQGSLPEKALDTNC